MAVKVKVGQTRNVRLVATSEKRPVITPDSVTLGIDTVGEYVRIVDAGPGIIVTPELNTESANLIISHADTSSVANTTSAGGLEIFQNIRFDDFGHVLFTQRAILNSDQFEPSLGSVNAKDFTIGSTSLTLGGSTDQILGLNLAEIGDFSITANTISSPANINFNLANADAVVNIGTHRIVNVEDPISDKDVVNKRFLESEINSITETVKVIADPVLPTDATNKRYVDNLITGVVVRPSALAATTEDLGATFASGNTSYSDTLTIPPVNVLYIDDVTTWTVGKNLVVKDQAVATQNGSYDLIQVGDATTSWIFQRADWQNEDSEIPGSYEFVTDGTIYGGTGWVITVADASTFEINDDAINWTQFQGEGTYIGGTGLTLADSVFSVDQTQILSTITPALDTVTITGTGALKLPVGNVAGRPTPAQGLVRFNSEDGQFEGYDGIAWAGLGGVIDVDQDTKIIADDGSDNDTLQFYAGGTLATSINANTSTFNTDLVLNKNVQFGNAITDTIVFRGGIKSHLSPIQDNYWDIGDTTNSWNTLHVRNITNTSEIVTIDTTGALLLPSANTALRPAAASAGMLRFNDDEGRFEGYDGTIWSGLAGSVIDLDKNTYIVAETSSGSNNNELDFWTDAIQRMQIGATGDLTFGSNLDKLIINYNTGDMFVNGKLTATNNLVIDPVGNIDVNSNVLTGLPNPVNPTDAVNLGYLDTQFSSGLTIIDQANTFVDGVNLLASPTFDLGRGLELIDLDTPNNTFKFGLDAPMVGSEGMYGTDGFTPRIRITEDGRIDFATEIPLELQANAIPNFTETSRDIIGLMFTDGTHEGVTFVNDDVNDVMNVSVDNFDITLAGDVSGSAQVTRLSDTTVTATITADYISNVTGAANSGIIVTHTAGPNSNSAIEVDYTELDGRYQVTGGNFSASRYLDADDTNFYMDPASISRINSMEVGFGATSSQIKMRDGPGSFSYLYGTAGKIGFLDNTFNFAAYSERSTGNWVVDNGDVRAERFIDVDATTYFLHPGGTDSNLKQINVEDKITVSDISIGGDVGIRTIKTVTGILNIESDYGISLNGGTGNDLDVNNSKSLSNIIYI